MVTIKMAPESGLKRLKSDGFLFLPLSKSASESLNNVFETARHFFEIPLAEKTLNTLPEECGYRPIGVEYSQSPEHPDQVESFSINRRTLVPNSKLCSACGKVLHERMMDAFDILESIAETLTIQLADEFSSPQLGRKLKGAFHRWSRLQVNYSRPAETAEPFINELHEDGDLITIACATGPGLELKTVSGEFLPITASASEVLVMPGEIAHLLSGGHIRPLWHRVRTESGSSERMSLLYFGDIDPRHCEPWVQNKVNTGVDIGARVLASVARFGLRGFTSE